MIENCPYCKKELNEGFLKGEGRQLRWYQEDELKQYHKFLNIGGEKLGKDELGSTLKSYRCINCKKIIINY